VAYSIDRWKFEKSRKTVEQYVHALGVSFQIDLHKRKTKM